MSALRPSAWIDPCAAGPWPASVRACVTTRGDGPGLGFDLGGVSPPGVIAAHRAELPARLGVDRVQFLQQVHGVDVLSVRAPEAQGIPQADAAVTHLPGVALAILTADCLPVLFADRAGTCVAAAHAGWRGLVAGVLEVTVRAMAVPAGQILAWLGPAIGQDAFEVGPEVCKGMLVSGSTEAARAELDRHLRPGRGDRWHVDLAGIAATRLAALGVATVLRSAIDSRADAARFYSYRRDGGRTGRQATLVWLSRRRCSRAESLPRL